TRPPALDGSLGLGVVRTGGQLPPNQQRPLQNPNDFRIPGNIQARTGGPLPPSQYLTSGTGGQLPPGQGISTNDFLIPDLGVGNVNTGGPLPPRTNQPLQ